MKITTMTEPKGIPRKMVCGKCKRQIKVGQRFLHLGFGRRCLNCGPESVQKRINYFCKKLERTYELKRELEKLITEKEIW